MEEAVSCLQYTHYAEISTITQIVINSKKTKKRFE